MLSFEMIVVSKKTEKEIVKEIKSFWKEFKKLTYQRKDFELYLLANLKGCMITANSNSPPETMKLFFREVKEIININFEDIDEKSNRDI